MTVRDELDDDIAKFTHDPLGHALYSYPWGEGELAGSSGPRDWQADILRVIGEHLQNPATRFQPLQVAVTSGHGIGKSALIAQVLKWAMDTCVDCRGVVTANTENQLRTKTWPEVSKWFRLAITRAYHTVTATAIIAVDKEHEREWRIDAVPWSETNTEAFAGLHNKGKRIVVVMDEGSAIPDKIWEVLEGALTDEETEIVWLVFGNPTRASGRFRECFRRFKHRWVTRQIDSRTVEGTNQEQLRKLVEDHGEDSDVVKIRVRGLFPSLSALQFYSEADVDAAYGREIQVAAYKWAPVILTLDNSWQGDDPWVIGKRQGLKFTVLRTGAKNDNDVHMANELARLAEEHKADAVFVDQGYGTGVVSVGRTLGYSWVLVNFGAGSTDPGCLNKRAEMLNSVKRWLQEGGCIDADPSFRDEFLSLETVPRMDGKLQFEAKHAMKARGLPSPNKLDALALSFAYPVNKPSQREQLRAEEESDGRGHDPFACIRRERNPDGRGGW